MPYLRENSTFIMQDHYKFVQATLQRLIYTSSDFIFTHFNPYSANVENMVSS
jgi:hypothetical protein